MKDSGFKDLKILYVYIEYIKDAYSMHIVRLYNTKDFSLSNVIVSQPLYELEPINNA